MKMQDSFSWTGNGCQYFSPIPNSQIIMNRRSVSISGNDGTFVFYVNINDTVVFQSLGYKSVTMVISDTLKGKEFVAGIYLNSDTLSIGEVDNYSQVYQSEIGNIEFTCKCLRLQWIMRDIMLQYPPTRAV